MHKILPLIPLCLAFATAHAHVVLEYQVATAASSYKATFQVGHGCGASPTRQLIVDIPAAMKSARPMPKAGWRIDTERSGDKVTRVTWTAKTAEDQLSSAFYDEFVVVAQTPAEAGPVYWPVVQVCDEGRAEWTQVPAPGQQFSELKTPAAALEILPAAGGSHQHTH
jgi:uncharacterized protein YcnI